MFKLISSEKRDYTLHRKYCTSLLYYTDLEKRFSTITLKISTRPKWQSQATRIWFSNQTQWDTHLDVIKRHLTAIKQLRQGRDYKTHSRISSYTLKSRSLSHVGVRNGLFYDDHVDIFQLPLETQRVLVFYYIYIYITGVFFVKANATRKHSGLIPNLCCQGGSGQGESVCDHCSGYTHLPVEWLEPHPSQSPNYTAVLDWLPQHKQTPHFSALVVP